MSSYVVQSVVLKRSKMTKREADRWIVEHGYKLTAPDITPHFYRYRQAVPIHSASVRFRTIKMGDIGDLIVMYTGPETE